MYSLDVNFLKDRTGNVVKDVQSTSIITRPGNIQKQLPLYIGAGVAVLLPALAGLATLLVNWQTARTEANMPQLDAEIARLQGESARIQELEATAAALHQDADGLINVFNQIKPWSALFQEITNQLPAEVQVNSINQADNKITLSGFAGNYGALNDFVLTLQGSQFLQAEQTKLLTATAAALPIAGEGTTAQSGETEDDVEQGTSTVLIPAAINYTIETVITDTPDQDLMQALIRNGAAGLVARFKYLELKGVLQRPSDAPDVPPPPILQPEGEEAETTS